MENIAFYTLLKYIKNIMVHLDGDENTDKISKLVNERLLSITTNGNNNLFFQVSNTTMSPNRLLDIHYMDDNNILCIINKSLLLNRGINLTAEEATALFIIELYQFLIIKYNKEITDYALKALDSRFVLDFDTYRGAGDNHKLVGAGALFKYYNSLTDFHSSDNIYYVNTSNIITDEMNFEKKEIIAATSALAGLSTANDEIYNYYKLALCKLSRELKIDVYTDITEYNDAVMFKINCILREFDSLYNQATHDSCTNAIIDLMTRYTSSINNPVFKAYIKPHLNKIYRSKYMPAPVLEAYEIQNEALFGSSIVKSIINDDADNDIRRMIDTISIDIEGIKELDDKYYIINKIVDQLKICSQTRKELLKKYNADNIKNQLNTISEYEAKLNGLREKVLTMKIAKKRYGVFAEVPVGYEG